MTHVCTLPYRHSPGVNMVQYSKITETPRHKCAGVLAWHALSLSCDRASWKVCQTSEPMHSGVEDIRASKQHAFLSCIDTLASDYTPSSGRCSWERNKRRERSSLHWDDGSSYRLTGSC